MAVGDPYARATSSPARLAGVSRVRPNSPGASLACTPAPTKQTEQQPPTRVREPRSPTAKRTGPPAGSEQWRKAGLPLHRPPLRIKPLQRSSLPGVGRTKLATQQEEPMAAMPRGKRRANVSRARIDRRGERSHRPRRRAITQRIGLRESRTGAQRPERSTQPELDPRSCPSCGRTSVNADMCCAFEWTGPSA